MSITKQYMVFDFLWSIAPKVPYKKEWENDTGYLDYAVEGTHAPKLEVSEFRGSTDNRNRKILLMGTPTGNLVIFKRYGKEDDFVLVSNTPNELSTTFTGAISIEDMVVINGFLKEQDYSIVEKYIKDLEMTA